MVEAIAQVVGPDLTTHSGWAGAGLLGLVLAAILFKVLPDKDKDQKELIAVFQKQLDDRLKDHREQVVELVREQIAANKEQREASDKRADAMMAAFNLHSRETRDDYKERLGMTLAHCEGESEKRSIEAKANNDALKTAIEGLAAVVAERSKR